MDDFETHPVGTADLVKVQQNLEHWRQEVGKLHSRVATLTDQLTRANAATAAAYEVAAQIADDFVRMRERQIETEKAKTSLHVNVPQIMRWQAGKVQSEAISAAIRALATPDQTAALDKMIAKAVGPYRLVLKDMVDSADEISTPLIEAQLLLAASKKGGAA